MLLDKIYKFDKITTYELGGMAAVQVLHEKGVDAVHTTCYEQKSKVMGLKVSVYLRTDAFCFDLYMLLLFRNLGSKCILESIVLRQRSKDNNKTISLLE